MRRLAKLAVGMAVPAALAAGLVASPSYAEGTGAHSGSVAQHQHRYDARTVFRGVFFGDGPLAASLPYTRSMPAASPSRTSAEDAVMDRIETAHPGLIESMSRGLTSGSLVRTRAAVEHGRRVIAAATPTVSQAELGMVPALLMLNVTSFTNVVVIYTVGMPRASRPDADVAAYQVVSALS